MNADLAFDAAVMMMRAGRRDDAAQLAWEIIRQKPDHADAWALRARVEAEAGRYANAMLHHGFAVRSAPQRHDLWVNRGIDAMGARMPRECEDSFKTALSLKETFEAHYNYGNFLCSAMRIEEAITELRAALAIDPDHAQAKTNLGSALIGQGSWAEGFQLYRHRFNSPGFPPAPRMDYPLWRGEPLEGKTILLFAEQGFGDEIMSLRFVVNLKDRGARVILAVRPPMFRLARTVPQVDSVIMMYDKPTWEPDYMCALLDVPGLTGTEPHSLPYTHSYLRAADRGMQLEFPAGLKVGLCWASGKRDLQPHVNETAKQKSLAFQQFAALARPGVNLVCLQQTHGAAEALRALGVHDPMPGVTDFADTAWIVSQLDLVITVDTSVAHLAGALGVPVWNLVRFDALWPWMIETSKTCWYDKMVIYRQHKPFDWSDPMARLMSDFNDLIESRRAAAA